MENHARRWALLGGLGIVAAGALACDATGDDTSEQGTLAALMDDGDAAAVAPGAMARPAPMTPPPRFCSGGDCSGTPLAFWKLDDCNPGFTGLEDSAFSTQFPHPAFRAVSVACVPGVIGQAVRISGNDDIVYAPDQPDFQFGAGLTVAAWVNPDRVTGTQTLVRKRFDGTSSFLLAIDGKKVHFVVRLTNGRLADVSAPIQARRFTHVAATYDGKQAVLYLDGVAADKARAVGTIAPGVGPIFVGNDANGRQLTGVVDEIWLNTLAAPADVVRALTCVRKPPQVAFTPAASPPQVAGATVPFDLSIKNQSSASCPVDSFLFFAANVGFPLTADPFVGNVFAGPGETAHGTVNVKSSRMAAVGAYPFEYIVVAQADSQQVNAQASYVVGTGPVACDGFPPFTPNIIGGPFSPGGAPFAFAAPGLAPPVVTPVPSPSGGIQSLQVEVNPGPATDPNTFLGFGLGFGNPPCVDASQFTGVRFTVAGDLGTCAMSFSVITSQNNSVANGPFGTCTGPACIPPMSDPIGVGTHVIKFADITGGQPVPGVDPTALNGVQWTLTAPGDGVTPPCVAHLTVTDVAFVTDADTTPHRVSFTFDRGTDGWMFNDFNSPPPTNIAVAVPPGVRPPTLTFNPADGDPSPGSLIATVPFTAVDQEVDIKVPVSPPVDLTGGTLHARVRLVSGNFAPGGVQFYALSGPPFAFAGSFVNFDAFVPGVWVPITLDLGAAAATVPGFDPTQIIQIGVQILSGFSNNGPASAGNVVFEIDTVTD